MIHLRNLYWSHWSWYSEGFFPPVYFKINIFQLAMSRSRWFGYESPKDTSVEDLFPVFRGEVVRKGLDPRSAVFVSWLTHWLGCCEKGDIWKMKPSWGSRPQETTASWKAFFPACVLFFSLSVFVSAVRFPLCHFSLIILPHQTCLKLCEKGMSLSLWAQINLPLKMLRSKPSEAENWYPLI